MSFLVGNANDKVVKPDSGRKKSSLLTSIRNRSRRGKYMANKANDKVVKLDLVLRYIILLLHKG